ncbi:MAG: chorismate mutase [Lentisphaerae bacterium GWF2_44_16]|nr:MAG: chorismate mutase [Lentisphaerae bacterium GWF2_44_16]
MGLEKLRQEIDAIDKNIIKLINERYRHVQEVGKWKKNCSHAIYVPEREKSLLENLEKFNEGPLTNKTLRAVYREIMSGALALEHPLNIAFFGCEASFTQLAALAKFGRSVNYVPRSSISDVFNDVEAERVNYGCVPIENSTEGPVNHTLDMLINSSVQICSEINMKIHHNLMAECEMSKIKKVYSHIQVIGQCRSWIQQNLPGVEVVEASNSTKAAEIAKQEKFSAAIASSLAAEIYKLNILAENIEDAPDNTTRFMILGKQEPQKTGDDKTSICFAIRDRIGALYDSLLPFKEEGITLSMIESRPSKRRNWEYFFFIDLLGHKTDKHVKKSLDKLENMAQSLRILGSYPRSNHIL